MIATGIVKRMDDLGRVEIPKELRRKMGISAKNNDPLEFYFEEDEKILCIRKYDMVSAETRHLYEAIDALKESEWLEEEIISTALFKIREAIKILEESEEEG